MAALPWGCTAWKSETKAVPEPEPRIWYTKVAFLQAVDGCRDCLLAAQRLRLAEKCNATNWTISRSDVFRQEPALTIRLYDF
jgi:hypothetical protein